MKYHERQSDTPSKATKNSETAESTNDRDMPRSNWIAVLGGVGIGLVIGFFVTILICWFVWIRHYEVQLREKEESLQRWQEQVRRDIDQVTVAKNISLDQVKTWVATNNELREHYTELQRQLHQREIKLASAGNNTVLIGVGAVVAVALLVVFLLRDAHRSAAITLENVASLAPEDMLRAVLVQTLAARKEPLTIAVEHHPAPDRPRQLPDDSE